jgi:hypothetical protein
MGAFMGAIISEQSYCAAKTPQRATRSFVRLG